MTSFLDANMTFHHFLVPEQSKKSNTNVLLGKPRTHREWIHMFLSYFGRNKPGMVHLLARLILM